MKKTFHIKGMHCVSCEIILEKELKKIPSLRKCRVNHKTGDAEIYSKGDIPQDQLEKAVHSCGYTLSEERQKLEEAAKPNYNDIAWIAVGLLFLFIILGKIEITRFLPNFGSQINVFIAVLMGVVASLSTCLALTGGIVMSFGATAHVHERKNHLLARAMPHLYFHLGRIGGFVLLGGILGAIGSKINYSLTFTGYLTILIAVVMFYIGLQILNIVPNITKLGFHLPKFLSKHIHSLEGSDHHAAPLVIGALTFFLPCGFTQTMQLAAVSSQSFWEGALIMGAFAIGTLPVLLSIGIGSTYAHKQKMNFFYQIIGVLIIFFSVYSFNSGLVLAGSEHTLDFWNRAGDSAAAMIQDGVQVVQMDVDWSFKPSQFEVKKDIPVRWEINGINVSGCSNEIVIPSLGIRQKINQGLNVVEFTPVKEGVLPFSCWMGMIGGQFNVTN
jgi:uncharacterized protein